MKKIFLAVFVFLLIMSPRLFADSNSNVKEPNVSGQFYPADSQELSKLLAAFFQAAKPPSSKKIAMLIAPHAGYIYSGPVAANSYKAASSGQYSTIIMIGPSHFFDFEGASIWAQGNFKTPLGTIAIDEKLAKALMDTDPQLNFNRAVFEREHSLEVQMPFLQTTFHHFKIVPILMGRPDYKVCQNLAAQLKKIIGERNDILLAISTDMSHYHKAPVAELMDGRTLQTIKNMDPQKLWQGCLIGEMELCGFTSVITGLLYAQSQGLNDVEILKYAHSGMVSGDNDRVVGYSSIVFSRTETKPAAQKAAQEISPSTFSPEQKKRLLQLARGTIQMYLQKGKTLEVNESDPKLQNTEGAFVTLTDHGKLRGCIGNILSGQPLYLTVRDMAIAAATQDPRFEPVKKEELAGLTVEISVLSVPQRINDVNKIQMGVHGVILGQGNKRGVFLPQVATETNWSRDEFLSQLCSQKAGLSPDCWRDPRTEIYVFTAEVFSESEFQ